MEIVDYVGKKYGKKYSYEWLDEDLLRPCHDTAAFYNDQSKPWS